MQVHTKVAQDKKRHAFSIVKEQKSTQQKQSEIMLEQDGLRQLEVDVDSYLVRADGSVDYDRVSDVY